MGADQSKEETFTYRPTSSTRQTQRQRQVWEEHEQRQQNIIQQQRQQDIIQQQNIIQQQRQQDILLQQRQQDILQQQREMYQARLQNLGRVQNIASRQSSQETGATARSIYPNLNNVNSNANGARTESTEPFVFVEINRPQPSAPSNETGTRARSASRPQRPSSNDNSELNCPICNNRFGVVIFQCSSGHSACEACKRINAPCAKPECRQPLTDIRNRALEAYVAELVEPCFNAKDGCRLNFKLVDMEFHLKECPFNEMSCPLTAIFGRCTWRGKLSHLQSHFDDKHPEHRQADVDTELCLFNLNDDQQIVYLVTLGVYNFLVAIKISKQNKGIFLTVQMIGTKHSAAKWEYEFHVYNKREPRRKYLYKDVCNSTGSTFDEIFREMCCANLPLSYATTFFNEGTLTYKFTIKKNEEYSNRTRGYGQRGRGRGRPRN